MADIEQSLQDIQQERSRLLTAKENLKTAIAGKGVTVSDDAKLDEYYTFVNGIQQGVEGGIDVSATTATEADVLSSAKFYKADGSFVSGTIQTVTPTLSGNVFSVGKGYVEEDTELTVGVMAAPSMSGNIITLYPGFLPNQTNIEIPKATATLSANVVTINAGYHDQNTLTVAESVITATETKVTIGVGYVGEAKEYNLGTDNVAGVLVDDNGVLKVQKLNFDGTTPSDGDVVEADKFYLFNTGKDEPNYGTSGGSMEIYKCAAVNEATTGDGYVITGAGVEAVNGTYTTLTNDTLGYSKVYANENGIYLGYQDGYHWEITDGIVNWYYRSTNGEDPTAVTWSVDGGTEPLPTITKVEGNPASWDGYKYDLDTKTFADTLTEGLEYKMTAPIVGKCYNSDATMLIDFYAPTGLIFYAPLHEQKATDETGIQLTNTGATFTTLKGVKCAYMDGTTRITASDANFPSGTKARTLSSFVYLPQVKDGTFVSYGSNAVNNRFAIGVESDMTLSVWGNANTVNYPDRTIEVDKWYHVTAIYDNTQESMYIDGVCIGSKTHENLNTILNECCIGMLTGAYLDQMIGYISEVKVWNRVLSEEEIKAEADRCLAMVTE